MLKMYFLSPLFRDKDFNYKIILRYQEQKEDYINTTVRTTVFLF